jgi:hypothetical protein
LWGLYYGWSWEQSGRALRLFTGIVGCIALGHGSSWEFMPL